MILNSSQHNHERERERELEGEGRDERGVRNSDINCKVNCNYYYYLY